MRLDALTASPSVAPAREPEGPKAHDFEQALRSQQQHSDEPEEAQGQPRLPGKVTDLVGAAVQSRAPKTQRPEPEAGEAGQAPRKSRPASEEALLVSTELGRHARSTTFIGTRAEQLKQKHGGAEKAVGVEQLATRARVEHEPLRLTAPGPHRPEPRKEPGRELKKADELIGRRADDASPPLASSVAGPTTTPETFRLEAPPPVQDAAPLAPLAPLMTDDASLRIVLLPTVARMSLDAGEAGRLNLQVKVRDGVTELRATGPAAPLLEARQGELRVALAKEGLALGHFDLTQSGSQHHHQHTDRSQPETHSTPTARRAAGSSDHATEAGRVHVKA